MEVLVTTGAIGRAKLQSNHHQQTNIQFFYRPETETSLYNLNSRGKCTGLEAASETHLATATGCDWAVNADVVCLYHADDDDDDDDDDDICSLFSVFIRQMWLTTAERKRS